MGRLRRRRRRRERRREGLGTDRPEIHARMEKVSYSYDMVLSEV